MKSILLGAASAIVFAFATPVLAEAPALTGTLGPRYGIALYGDLKYPENFTHFEYVNPNAPKGGAVKLAETGSFDSVNPFILKGVKAPGLITMFDSLMVQSQDEPQSMYGLIAESVTLAPDNSYAEFSLRPQARWHDGTPITADDVVFSFHTLKDKGDPTYKIMYTPIIACEKTGERTVKFTFNDTKNRELPMLAGAMPVISKAYYSTHDFEKTTLEPPLGSGAYKIESVDQGRAIVYTRVKDYWAQDLPVNKGQNNFDTIRYDLYRDENVALEGLKAGEYDFRREYIARNWATAYDTPAVRDGRVIKREIPDYTPQGMQSFIFNTRKAKFADRRVREAISRSMDFEWQNKTIFYGAYIRNKSFFENTEFQSKGAPEGKELELLSPFAADLPTGTLEREFANPVTDGQGNARESLLIAQKLLEDAGYMIKDGKRVDAKGEQLSVEFMLRQPTLERVIGPMRKNLERLGIASSIRIVDDSQYQKRTDESDFDVVSIWINRGLFFPGNEQMALWHSSQADVKGGNNLGGVKNKAVDAMLEALTNAQDKESLLAAGRALDRILLFEHYVIPHWHSGVFRVAYWNKFGMPDISPKYNLGFQTWWVK
jgi:microcin C transport system substrate-binding protein